MIERESEEIDIYKPCTVAVQSSGAEPIRYVAHATHDIPYVHPSRNPSGMTCQGLDTNELANKFKVVTTGIPNKTLMIPALLRIILLKNKAIGSPMKRKKFIIIEEP